MGRNILLITTDQQRYDGLGFGGGQHARTPVLDRLAREGLHYTQARNQCAVCMPARSTILTGQSIRRHGVTSNGIALPAEHPSIAHALKAAGYATALVGKAHFEPHAARDFFENTAATEGSFGPHRGFDHMELAGHTGRAGRSLFHYPRWLAERHPEFVEGFHEYTSGANPSARGGGDSGAPQVARNPIPVELYHTHWTARRSRHWLSTLADDADWFCWMSFPDPHHPWDLPDEARTRFDWRDLPLPAGYPGSREACEAVLATKPWHWLAWYRGEAQLNFEVPPAYIPAETTADQIREVNAIVHAKNELIDEAVGEVLDYLEGHGWDERTDIFYTTDHGELQGDFGMLFKGPYHVNALTHVPLLWRPAPIAGIHPALIDAPVGHLDIAPTIAQAACIEAPRDMQGTALPHDTATAGRGGVITEWIDNYNGNEIELETLVRDDYLITRYGQTNRYAGTEGELYNLKIDPHQWRNLWEMPKCAGLKSDLLDHLRAQRLPGRDQPLRKVAPV